MARDISEAQIWQKIIKALNRAGVEYVLVGAAALVVHGIPRSTLDLDIYVTAEEETLVRIFKISGRLGLKSEQKDMLKISRSPELFKGQWACFSFKGQDVLDVFFADEGQFKRLYRNSEVKKDRRISIRVASLADIASMKKASGRPVDMSDLDSIRELMRYKR